MRRLCVALLLCSCSLAVYGQKTRYGQYPPYAKQGVDYPIQVHVSGLRYRTEDIGGGQIGDVIYADAVINGKKVELRGDGDEVPFRKYQLSLGDFQARLLKDLNKTGGTSISQEYEVVLPNRIVWRCVVSGLFE
ncbi:hypothetical protein [Acidicapsa ligni]|uniref:hypothetical protein n=1 Tax=Acidicapsa ligni TaxID=542300 RepID=UPI0021DF8DFF|nr:hypothetical protein [Acidicapsa ligni]